MLNENFNNKLLDTLKDGMASAESDFYKNISLLKDQKQDTTVFVEMMKDAKAGKITVEQVLDKFKQFK